MVMPTAPGWYPDPQQPGQERYWSGTEWSKYQVRPAEPAAPPPPRFPAAPGALTSAPSPEAAGRTLPFPFPFPGPRRRVRPARIGGAFVVLVVVVAIIIEVTSHSTRNPIVDTGSVTTAGLSTNSAAKGEAAAAPSATTVPVVAHVGGTVAVNDGAGGDSDVTLVAVIDPASGADQFSTPDAGNRFVGVELRIADGGSGVVQSDANEDVTVVGSDGQTYTSAFDDIAGCTNFNEGAYALGPGESATGCVVFEVPTGVRVTQVIDQPGIMGGSAGDWQVP
jgi:Protein of unknown function (DUF2510)/Domain of unknown function (DUF4352)